MALTPDRPNFFDGDNTPPTPAEEDYRPAEKDFLTVEGDLEGDMPGI